MAKTFRHAGSLFKVYTDSNGAYLLKQFIRKGRKGAFETRWFRASYPKLPQRGRVFAVLQHFYRQELIDP